MGRGFFYITPAGANQPGNTALDLEKSPRLLKSKKSGMPVNKIPFTENGIPASQSEISYPLHSAFKRLRPRYDGPPGRALTPKNNLKSGGREEGKKQEVILNISHHPPFLPSTILRLPSSIFHPPFPILRPFTKSHLPHNYPSKP